jgi:hypothetical protein
MNVVLSEKKRKRTGLILLYDYLGVYMEVP